MQRPWGGSKPGSFEKEDASAPASPSWPFWILSGHRSGVLLWGGYGCLRRFHKNGASFDGHGGWAGVKTTFPSFLCSWGFTGRVLKWRNVPVSANFLLPIDWNAIGERARVQAVILDQEKEVWVWTKAEQQDSRSLGPWHTQDFLPRRALIST